MKISIYGMKVFVMKKDARKVLGYQNMMRMKFYLIELLNMMIMVRRISV